MKIRVIFATKDMKPMGLAMNIDGNRVRKDYVDMDVDMSEKEAKISNTIVDKLYSQGIEFIDIDKFNILIVDMNNKSDRGYKVIAAISYFIRDEYNIGLKKTIVEPTMFFRDDVRDKGFYGASVPFTKICPLGWYPDIQG